MQSPAVVITPNEPTRPRLGGRGPGGVLALEEGDVACAYRGIADQTEAVRHRLPSYQRR